MKFCQPMLVAGGNEQDVLPEALRNFDEDNLLEADMEWIERQFRGVAKQ